MNIWMRAMCFSRSNGLEEALPSGDRDGVTEGCFAGVVARVVLLHCLPGVVAVGQNNINYKNFLSQLNPLRQS